MPDLPVSGLPENTELEDTDYLVTLDTTVNPPVLKKSRVSSVIQRNTAMAVALAVAFGN